MPPYANTGIIAQADDKAGASIAALLLRLAGKGGCYSPVPPAPVEDNMLLPTSP